MTDTPRKITDDPHGAASLIRRLIMEQATAYWRRYLLAFLLMGVAAATTAGSASTSTTALTGRGEGAPEAMS